MNESVSKTKIEKLKELIKKSEEKLKQTSLNMERLSEEVKKAKEDWELLDAKSDTSKILTLKQQKLLKAEHERLKLKAMIEERRNIDKKTQEEFEKACLLREEAYNKSDFEKQEAERLALKTEIDALSKNIDIKSDIIQEKSNEAQNILAGKISEEFKINKTKKMLSDLQGLANKNNQSVIDMRNNLNISLENKNNFLLSYKNLEQEINALKLKSKEYQILLKEKKLKLKECN